MPSVAPTCFSTVVTSSRKRLPTVLVCPAEPGPAFRLKGNHVIIVSFNRVIRPDDSMCAYKRTDEGLILSTSFFIPSSQRRIPLSLWFQVKCYWTIMSKPKQVQADCVLVALLAGGAAFIWFVGTYVRRVSGFCCWLLLILVITVGSWFLFLLQYKVFVPQNLLATSCVSKTPENCLSLKETVLSLGYHLSISLSCSPVSDEKMEIGRDVVVTATFIID